MSGWWNVLKSLNNRKIQFLEFSKNISAVNRTSVRFSSYVSSHPVRDLSEYPEVEIVKNPPEWKFVQKLLASNLIPKPKSKQEYPSGWQPPKHIDDLTKYVVIRTKNHMMPVYLQKTHRGLRQVTVVRKIEGDIWALERELRNVVEKYRNGKVCATRINEMSGQVRIHGDYVNLIKHYLASKGC